MKKQELLTAISRDICPGFHCYECPFCLGKSHKIECSFGKLFNLTPNAGEILCQGIKVETNGYYFLSSRNNKLLIDRIIFDYKYPIITEDNIKDIKVNDKLICNTNLFMDNSTVQLFTKDKNYKVYAVDLSSFGLTSDNEEFRTIRDLGPTNNWIQHFRTIRKF